MNEKDMLEFLLENSVHIKSELTGFCMIADKMHELGGEFVVYKYTKDLYRGANFKDAMMVMDGKAE